MIHKAIDQIQVSDIQSLVDNAVIESATIEYKQGLHDTKDSKIHEFLADVSSFANSKGGDIIYGIAEKKDEAGKNTGVPEKITPLLGLNSDQVKLQLEQSIRSSISPRMRFQIEPITGFGEDGQGVVLIIRIPKSLAGPHMVTYQHSSKFYSRTSAGKYLLDVREIRDAFLATESQGDRIRRFRIDRISKILADETPVPLSSSKRFVLHVVPIGSFLNRDILELTNRFYAIKDKFTPMGGLNGNTRFNLDGILCWHERNKDPGHGYCQLFFDGSVEIVLSNNFVNAGGRSSTPSALGSIPAIEMEGQVVHALRKLHAGYEILQTQGPYAVTISILGCKGCWQESRLGHAGEHRLESDVINLREIVLESLSNDLAINLKPLFDQFWNAFGYLGSNSYDQAGNWCSR